MSKSVMIAFGKHYASTCAMVKAATIAREIAHTDLLECHAEFSCKECECYDVADGLDIPRCGHEIYYPSHPHHPQCCIESCPYLNTEEDSKTM